MRRLWPDIVEATKVRRRMAWIHLSQNCQVVGLEGTTLTLGFTNAGARDSFISTGCPDVVREAAIDVVGADWTIDTIVDPGAQPGAVADAPVTVRSAVEPEAPAAPAAEPEPEPEAPPASEPEPPATSAARNAAREAIKDTRPGGCRGHRVRRPQVGRRRRRPRRPRHRRGVARFRGPAGPRARGPDDRGDPQHMTDNPFEALGAGGFDMNALLQQAQQMQEQLASAQERLADATADGTVAGGAVTVTVNGVGEVVKVAIKAGQFDGSDADDLSDLGDMIVAAYRDAKAQADAMASEALGPLAGGMGGLGGGAPDAAAGPDRVLVLLCTRAWSRT